eukprot:GFUD01034855.1.p1 GENE.GFUD01034855.1~~GFUD01034855.1.p1  ORF type:complete len:712 (+),score=176.10 GFUD01034855.1:397-2532(+)
MGDQEPHTNGVNGDGNSSDDEEDKSKMRPVDIEADVKEMERRKRVEAIMNSQLFREELERVVGDSIRESGAEGIGALLSDVMNIKSGTAPSSSCVVPINDIRGIDSMVYAKGEKLLRCKLAAVYRLIDLYGWTQGIYNHVTARVSQDSEHFLLNPFGMMYNEVTASSLVKVNMQGDTVEEGTTNFGVNQAGFMLHSAIHAARPDIKCVIHLHTPSIVAVSTMKCGLLPLSQESCLIGDVSYHSYNGIVIDPEERQSIAKDLGPNNKVMFLRNHGVVCCGKTMEEAFHVTYHTVLACDTQLKMMPYGLDNLVMIDDEVRRKTFEIGQRGGGGVNTSKKEWGIGELEFEALMRMLDNSGFRTGFAYLDPLVRKEPARMANDVELPPTVSNLGFLMEEDELYKDSPLKGLLAQMARATRSTNKTKWVNSPNVYQKVEVLETGTTDPKKITKWVSEGSPSHSTPIKIDSPNQFVPLNSNPKEFKKVQKLMKEGRRLGGVHAGPESKVLDGVSWEEARQMADAHPSAVGEPYGMKVGAASKGIIQRDFQHHATVFKSPYAKNPFDSVSNEELEEYKRIIDKKSKGEVSPTSPILEEDTIGDTTDPDPDPDSQADFKAALERSLSTRQPGREGINNPFFERNTPRSKSLGRGLKGEHTNYEEETDGNRTFSEGEGDTSRATDPDSALSPKKEKKKKGLRTPSFLKKKKKDKKEKEKA